MTRKLVSGLSFEAEVQLALTNIFLVLDFAGCTYRDVVLSTWETPDIADLLRVAAAQNRLGRCNSRADTVSRPGIMFHPSSAAWKRLPETFLLSHCGRLPDKMNCLLGIHCQ